MTSRSGEEKSLAVEVTKKAKREKRTCSLIRRQRYDTQSHMESAADKWTEKGKYDLVTARAMLKSRRYVYVAFMCQQAIEKHLKAIFTKKTKNVPPYTHNLAALSQLIEVTCSEEDKYLLITLTNFYLNTRYPDFKQKMTEKIDRVKASDLLKKTEAFIKWLKKEYTI